jgi:3-methyladenine DNA glycosylase/8-oxoguanine DNA glycosylase
VIRALRTDAGPATIRFEPTRGTITVTAWGPGAPSALRDAPAILGFDDDHGGFVAHHEVVRRAHRRFNGARIGRDGTIVETAMATVLEQKVTSVEAHRSWAALLHRYGDPAPGPFGLRVAPPAERVAQLHYADWHPLGVERRRAETVRRLCTRADRLRALRHESPAEARRVLEHFAGVGPWTSATVAWHALGDRDVVVTGDYHFPHIVSYTLTGRRRGSDDEMIELLAPYRGQRTRALRLVLLGGTAPPRRAPKARLRRLNP